jgi:hypothetical protein
MGAVMHICGSPSFQSFQKGVEMRFSLIIPAMLLFIAASFAGAPEARAASVTPGVAPAVTQETATAVHYRRHRRHYRWRPYYSYGYGPGYYGYGSPFYFSFGHRRHRYGHRRWRHDYYDGGYYRPYRRHYRRHWY